ncbi:MAG: ribonuclease J [Dehalococcoidia bacterium]
MENIKIIPFGGLGKIGKNMLALELNNSILIIDCGVMFPDETMHGVDVVIPDYEYLEKRKNSIEGIVITHGHEDHIGGLPHILPQLQAPVYGTALSMGLVSAKLKNTKSVKKNLVNTVEPGEPFDLGPFNITLFNVNHSIPDAAGIIIKTPLGTIVHTGDFKLDHTPVHGKPTDFHRISEVGDSGVLLLLSDSTYADTPGYTPSEEIVGKSLDRIIGEAPSRVIVASFASLISRIQQIGNAAVNHNRKMGIVGRSMIDNVRLATEMGFLNLPSGTILSDNQLKSHPPESTIIMTTGAQGEPTSALAKMSTNQHPSVTIQPEDTIILSSNPIPGNETSVARTIDNLFKLGANVLYSRVEQVHVRGHASQEELKLLLRLVKPKFFIPIHGDHRHLVHHSRLAQSVGMSEKSIFVMENGDVLDINSKHKAKIVNKIPLRDNYVDGKETGKITNKILKDRANLSKQGVFSISIALDIETGDLVGNPEITSKGFIETEESVSLIETACEIVEDVLDSIEDKSDLNQMERKISEQVSNFLYKQTRMRPVVITTSVEV